MQVSDWLDIVGAVNPSAEILASARQELEAARQEHGGDPEPEGTASREERQRAISHGRNTHDFESYDVKETCLVLESREFEGREYLVQTKTKEIYYSGDDCPVIGVWGDHGPELAQGWAERLEREEQEWRAQNPEEEEVKESESDYSDGAGDLSWDELEREYEREAEAGKAAKCAVCGGDVRSARGPVLCASCEGAAVEGPQWQA